MSTPISSKKNEYKTTWVNHKASLFTKKQLIFKSKETNHIFGEFNLMELKNNSEVNSLNF